MFNFANIIKAVVTVAAAINTIIRKVTETNPVVAKVVKTFDNFVSSFTGSGSSSGDSSGKGKDSVSGGLSEAEQRREEERKQRELDRRASAFDEDIARKLSDQRPDVEADSDAAGTQAAPSLRDLAARAGLDLDRWIQEEPMSAELQVAASGNPIAQALLQMLRHERSQLEAVYDQASSPIACMISTFGLAAEDDEDTIQAAQLCEMALSGRSDTDGQIYLAYAGDNLASLFTESEIDPCEGLVDEALDRCQNVERLRDFGVTVGNNPLAEGAFSDKQLQTLNMTVEQVSTYIAGQAAAAGYDLTPEEAFQIVFGNVEFISDPMLDEQLGKTEGQTIRLRPSALDIVDTLVPAHELAHIFQNRLGETENKMFVQVTRFVEIIDNEGNVIGIEEKPEDQAIEVPASTPIVAVHYVIETGGRWYPFGMPIWEQDETGRLAQKRDEAGNLIWNIEPGTYIPARYDDNLQARISEDLSNSLFFNERRRETNPTEGFADTLAILTMRGRDLLFDDPRGKFFDEQMPYWIRSLIEPTRYPFPAPLNALEYENEDQDNADDEQ